MSFTVEWGSVRARDVRETGLVGQRGSLVGMAFVISRPGGRFEIRESVHTASGPRARSLVGFKTLTNRALTTAATRAQRPFDAEAVIASARRAGAPIDLPRPAGGVSGQSSRRRFLEASRRMAAITAGSGTEGVSDRGSDRADPGAALIELLGFADAVKRSRPESPRTALEFPVLARLREDRAHRVPARAPRRA